LRDKHFAFGVFYEWSTDLTDQTDSNKYSICSHLFNQFYLGSILKIRLFREKFEKQLSQRRQAAKKKQ
jgi:hypothetical protein